MAATSGILSTLISNPFDLITCRLMVQDRSGYKLERALRNRAKYYHGIGDVITKVYRRRYFRVLQGVITKNDVCHTFGCNSIFWLPAHQKVVGNYYVLISEGVIPDC